MECRENLSQRWRRSAPLWRQPAEHPPPELQYTRSRPQALQWQQQAETRRHTFPTVHPLPIAELPCPPCLGLEPKATAVAMLPRRKGSLPHASAAYSPSRYLPGVTPERRTANRSTRRQVAGILLSPGAGGSADSPALVVLASALERTGVTVERMDFPYRLAGRRRPDAPAVLEEAARERASAFADRLGVTTGDLVLGGRSMGGRIFSQVAAAGLPVAGLALVSYPLHPPGRPERLRTSHFPALRVPCLFVSGTRDAFGAPVELEAAAATIPGEVTHAWLEGGDHGLARRSADAAEAVVSWLATTFRLAATTEASPSSNTPACG